ncbi:hypothetical protein V2J09_014215 [Rumex salicifolius]
MAAECSPRKGKNNREVNSDHNVGSRWKSPLKLLSPIVYTKTIYLHDWWLVQLEEGEGIAVGGFTIERENFETSFCSASIKERHDNSTLETSDGYTIYISGLINRSETEKNGFPPEVCSYFLNGFPLNWDDLASQQAKEGSHSFPPGSFQDMTCLQKRDLLLFAQGAYEEDAIREHLFNDLLVKLKPALDDTAHDCDLPSSGKSKGSQEMGEDNHTSLNLNGVRTRNQLRSLKVNKTKRKARK